jgi:hypothetical protein
MRYGEVQPEDVARLALKADRAGQLGLAVRLYALAGSIDPSDRLGLPRACINSPELQRGVAIGAALPNLGRKPKVLAEPSGA